MKDQLRLLQALQVIDARAHELRKAMTTLPEKLAPTKQDLTKLEGLLGQARKDLASTENWKAEQEDFIKREEEAVRQARSKLQASKNTKDYSHASREVENKRRSVSEREDEVLKVIGAMEQSRTSIDANEKDVSGLRDRVQREESEITAKVAELAAQVKELEASRKSLTAQLPAELLKRYETVLKRRAIAVVPVKGGICQGCFMSLPPQLSNIIARMTTLESCPQCQRLLYRVELLDSADSADGGDQPA